MSKGPAVQHNRFNRLVLQVARTRFTRNGQRWFWLSRLKVAVEQMRILVFLIGVFQRIGISEFLEQHLASDKITSIGQIDLDFPMVIYAPGGQRCFLKGSSPEMGI